ncbi:hypothetical protein llap_14085 [Limosa lapponica baueri]|uniref:Uncharacterized protein n=1 Tax=Limosa lapponica baueri TaxID=1758121 RepID=A0A2I0TP63_LIMLA|nr:hypothetical protein llap_14085 [Limosa lapponica baueri]
MKRPKEGVPSDALSLSDKVWIVYSCFSRLAASGSLMECVDSGVTGMEPDAVDKIIIPLAFLGYTLKFMEFKSSGACASVNQIFFKSYIMYGIQIWEDQGLFLHFKLPREELGQPGRTTLPKRAVMQFWSFALLDNWIDSPITLLTLIAILALKDDTSLTERMN